MELSDIKRNKHQLRKEFLLEVQAEILRRKPDDSEVGYIPQWMSQVSLPMKRPKSKTEYIRRNGAVTMVLLSPSFLGLPYGVIPRLLLLYITTYAVRTKMQDITLGRNLNDFMMKIMNYKTGLGINRLRTQSLRLFSSSFSVFINTEDELNYASHPLVDKYTLFKKIAGSSLTLHLSDYFWRNLQCNPPIPVDLRAVGALRNSPLNLDLYFWLKKRLYSLSGSVNFPTENFFHQFGTSTDFNKPGYRVFLQRLEKNLSDISGFFDDDFTFEVSTKNVRLTKKYSPKIPPCE